MTKKGIFAVYVSKTEIEILLLVLMIIWVLFLILKISRHYSDSVFLEKMRWQLIENSDAVANRLKNIYGKASIEEDNKLLAAGLLYSLFGENEYAQELHSLYIQAYKDSMISVTDVAPVIAEIEWWDLIYDITAASDPIPKYRKIFIMPRSGMYDPQPNPACVLSVSEEIFEAYNNYIDSAFRRPTSSSVDGSG